MIDTAVGGMVTRFVFDGKSYGLLTVASSKRSEQSFMEEYIKTLSQTEGNNVLVVDQPVWKVKPQGTYGDPNDIFYVGLGNKFLENIVIPDSDVNNLDTYKEKGYQILEVPAFFKAKFIEDIDRNLCDIAGISSSSQNKYMSGQVVKEAIDENLKNPFLRDVLEIGNAPDDFLQYSNFFNLSLVPDTLRSMPLFIHLDMSVSGDMTGIAGVWITGKKPSTNAELEDKDLMFRLAFSTSVKAPKGRQISFEKNRNFIRWLKEKGFNIRMVTCDTYQSYDLRQILASEGYNTEILSVDRVDTDRICKPYQFLKSAVYEKRLQMYKSNRLFDEFVDVERNLNTGKVDHTPNGHKDVLDAVAAATFMASKHAAEFAYLYGESLLATLAANEDNINEVSEKQRLLNEFEAELTKLSFSSFTSKYDSGMQLEEDEDWYVYTDADDGIILI